MRKGNVELMRFGLRRLGFLNCMWGKQSPDQSARSDVFLDPKSVFFP